MNMPGDEEDADESAAAEAAAAGSIGGSIPVVWRVAATAAVVEALKSADAPP